MATVAFQDSSAQANPGPGRLQRFVQQPLLIGLVAAGGAGIYAWSVWSGPAAGMDEFAPARLPAAPQVAQVPAAIPEVGFMAAPVTATSPVEATLAAAASPAAARPAPAARPARPVRAPAVAVIPAAPRAARSPAPDYSYVNRVVLPGPAPVPELPARTVRVEMPPPAPVALAPQTRRVTGSFAAPALQPVIEQVSVQLAPAQALMASPQMTAMQPAAPGAAPAAPLQLAPAQPALTVEPLGQQAVPLITPPAAAAPMGASPSPLQTDPQLAPSTPAAQPLQTPPGAAPADPTALSAAGFQKLDDSQLAGIKSITGQSKQGRAAIQSEPARSAAPVASPAKQGESAQAGLLEKVIGSAIDLSVPVQVGGAGKGELPVRIGANGKASVRLGELLALFGDRMEPGALAALGTSPAAHSFVGFDALRASGIAIAYDAARGEVRLSALNA